MSDGTSSPREIIYLPEVEARTGVPLWTLRYWRQRGEGPRMFRLGRRVVAYSDDVDAWIAECAAADHRGRA